MAAGAKLSTAVLDKLVDKQVDESPQAASEHGIHPRDDFFTVC